MGRSYGERALPWVGPIVFQRHLRGCGKMPRSAPADTASMSAPTKRPSRKPTAPRPPRKAVPDATAAPVEKNPLHPRNRHQGRYDFPALIKGSPELAAFVIINPYGKQSIDFADPAAVRLFNRA